MGYTCRQLLQSCLGVAVLPLFFLIPGYLTASAGNLQNFRNLSFRWRLLWSIPLSATLSLLLAVHPGLPLSGRVTSICFLIIGAAGAVLIGRDLRHRFRQPVRIGKNARWWIGGVLILVLYCLLAPLGVQVGHRLFEHASSETDWSVRIQLVNACIRGGAKPVNPMFAFHGRTVPLHTYFYWYVLCAQLATLTGIGAQSALTASCVAAALTLLASMLLFLRYTHISSKPIGQQAAAMALGMCVIGLEILVVISDALRHRLRPDPQLAFRDHAPGFLYATIWSPHHVAGLACCLFGALLIGVSRHAPLRSRIGHAVIAGMCFATAAGTSTYAAGIFCIAGVFLLIDALRHRDRKVMGALAVAAVVAGMLTVPFARQMVTSSAGSRDNAERPVHRRLRYSLQASDFITYFGYLRQHVTPPARPTIPSRLLRTAMMLGMLLVDLGLVLFVAVYRGIHDWRRRHVLSNPERLLWLIFLAALAPCFVLSSANDSHAANDLSYHAASIMRLVAVLWMVPMLLAYDDRRRRNLELTGWSRRFERVGVSLFVLGALSQAAQLFANRFTMPLVDAGLVRSIWVGQRVPHVGTRFDQIRQAMDAAAAVTPPDGIVQIYPHDRLHPALLMYTHRQMAASDDGCNLPFGGSDAECTTMTTEFNELFGGSPWYHGIPIHAPRLPFDPSKTSAANFLKVCRENHLSAVVADYTSPAWQHPGTWVWTLKPVYANATARVFLCPASGQAPLYSSGA